MTISERSDRMDRCLPLFLSVLLLTGCAARETPCVSPAASSSAAPPVLTLAPETLEAFQARLETEALSIRDIVPYGEDYLVVSEASPESTAFFWYYGKTSLAAPVCWCYRNILRYEILSCGRVRILLGENNFFNAQKDFPVYWEAEAHIGLSGGEPSSSLYTDGTASEKAYYAPVSEPHSVGWLRKEAVVGAAVTPSGIEVVFGPQEADIAGFDSAVSSAALTEISCEGTTMTLTFRQTALTSGPPPIHDDPQQQKYHAEYVELYGFPTAFPAGTLEGESLFIRSAAIQEAGEDTVLTLELTEKARYYTVETGQLLRNESRPCLRLAFRDDIPW